MYDRLIDNVCQTMKTHCSTNVIFIYYTKVHAKAGVPFFSFGSMKLNTSFSILLDTIKSIKEEEKPFQLQPKKDSYLELGQEKTIFDGIIEKQSELFVSREGIGRPRWTFFRLD